MTLALRPNTSSFLSGTGSSSIVEEWRPLYSGGTALNLGCILDTGVRTAVSDWNDVLFGVDDILAKNDAFTRVLPDPLVLLHRSAMWIATGSQVMNGPVVAAGGAAGVIQELADRLDFPIDRILTAADIKPRTYYIWKERTGSQPRLASQGRLWALKQCIEDLTNLVETPSRWLTDPTRIGLFETGAFDQLVELAVSQSRPAYTGNGGSGFTGDDSLIVVGTRDDRPPVLRKARRVRRR